MADNKDLNNETIDMDVEVPTVLRKSELDINKNLGKFGQSKARAVVDAAAVKKAEQIEQNAKEEANKQEEVKINFNKFSAVKTNTDSLYSRTQVKMQSILGKRKSLVITWIVIFAVLIILIATQVCYIHFGNQFLNSAGGHKGSPIQSYINCGKVANVLSYISLCLPIVPMFALLICWLVGINGTISSVKFHTWLWLILAISVFLMLLATVLFATYVGESLAEPHAI